MKSNANLQGQEISEQREEKMKREKKKKRNKEKSPAAGRFHNWLIYRYLKKILFGISSRIHERRYQPETSSWRKFLTRKKFLREKTMIKNFFKYNSGVNHYHFALKSPNRNDCLNIFAPLQK